MIKPGDLVLRVKRIKNPSRKHGKRILKRYVYDVFCDEYGFGLVVAPHKFQYESQPGFRVRFADRTRNFTLDSLVKLDGDHIIAFDGIQIGSSDKVKQIIDLISSLKDGTATPAPQAWGTMPHVPRGAIRSSLSKGSTGRPIRIIRL